MREPVHPALRQAWAAHLGSGPVDPAALRPTWRGTLAHALHAAARRAGGRPALEITGRLKKLIVSGGLNVSPREVELALEAHPEVARAAVVGVPSERWGEEVVAFVVGEAADDDALRAHVRERLSGYKVPKRVLRVDELPVSDTGKVRRGELVERARREEAAR